MADWVSFVCSECPRVIFSADYQVSTQVLIPPPNLPDNKFYSHPTYKRYFLSKSLVDILLSYWEMDAKTLVFHALLERGISYEDTNVFIALYP